MMLGLAKCPPSLEEMGGQRAGMATFTRRRAPDDAPRSPAGVVAATRYEGPNGPAYAGYGGDRLSTHLWGPHVPEATTLDYGPYGRLDGERHGLLTPVPLRVGELTGEVIQPDWALFSLRRRGVQVTLASRSWLYRIAGLTRARRLERRDGTEVATDAGAFGTSRVARSADVVEVAVLLVMLSGVPSSELTVK